MLLVIPCVGRLILRTKCYRETSGAWKVNFAHVMLDKVLPVSEKASCTHRFEALHGWRSASVNLCLAAYMFQEHPLVANIGNISKFVVF